MDNLELFELLKFNFKDDLITLSTDRPNRTVAEITPAILFRAAGYLFNEHGLRFIITSAMDVNGRFEILYHFSKDDTGMIITLKVSVPYDNPEVDSLVPLFVAADWIEREVHELFGIRFSGHPNLKPLISDGNWEKDYFPYKKQPDNKVNSL